MIRPFDIVLVQKCGPHRPGQLYVWSRWIEKDVQVLLGPDRSGWYAELTLANGQRVIVRRLSEERRIARAQLAEYRTLVQSYREAYPGTAEWFQRQHETLAKPIMPSVPNDAEVSFNPPSEVDFGRVAEKTARLARGFTYDKETGVLRLNGVTRISLRDPLKPWPHHGYPGYKLSCDAYEDEIRRMLGLWVSELEPEICYGPCSIPWGLHPAGHAVMGVKTKMTIRSIYYPKELDYD